MTDQERLDWLDEDSNRLEDVRGWLNNEASVGQGVRDAIDALSGMPNEHQSLM